MADPQNENGYTKIANELLEQLYSSNFNATQLDIIYCIIRYTYGFKRKTHKLSVSFIAKAIKKSEITVKKEIKKLISNKVIFEETPPYFNATRKVGINKNYDEWLVSKTIPCIENEPGVQLDTIRGIQNDTIRGIQSDTQEIKKEIKKESVCVRACVTRPPTQNAFSDKMDEFLKENDMVGFNANDI